jgi:hypothetical protein
MGNCGSALDCDKCFASKPREGCATELDINADIAGIGVSQPSRWQRHCCQLTMDTCIFLPQCRFYVFCGLRKLLLGSSTTEFNLSGRLLYIATVQIRRGPFTGTTTPLSIASSNSHRGEAVVKFVHPMSDQQITTGFALLIAAVANKCRLSLHEIHIVPNLAYFSLSSHVMSLRIIRGHPERRTIIRRCRIAFTVLFFALFCFTYLLNGTFVTDGTKS